ncbi:hypothetical protein HYDPIDRAFT_136870 [Hydnomerulius pinastri MD-312]|uniref:Uncharacterized protein n=1 Tax=Hydnomerulius pinastri MD-312 TaxID=994086 RepID=A0A0C9VV56_9AGAM|nr:hypothetical protein HYDPIDRAFT_136870 [Hydnomerulius pinastri MD-312]
MSHSLIYSAGAGVNPLSLDDDEDNDICPVCDGDCTCDNRPRPLPAPIASSGGARYVTTPTASSSSSRLVPGIQSLKIKLTVPISMQNKARSLGSAPKKSRADGSSATSNGVAGSSSVFTSSGHTHSHRVGTSSTAGHGHHSPSEGPAQKRRGRPPKAAVVARDKIAAPDRPIRGNEATTLSQSQSHLQSHPSRSQRSSGSKAARPNVKSSGQPKSNIKASRQTPKSQAKGTIGKAASKKKQKKKQAFLSDDTDSDLDDLDDQSVDAFQDDEDDASSGRFPTFVSADGLTSSASDSSDSDCESSGFGSDSSLEAEEESYILTEQRRHDKARVRRELLGDDGHKHKDPHNNWVIRPRKKSVGLSDVDMDGDSDDLTEDEDDDQEEEMDDEEEDDETDGQASRVMYSGVATGWSDDEESSFDADIFFANLSDTTSDDALSDDEDGPQQDVDVPDAMTDSISSLRSVDFEVTEAWDGQIVFTNGSNDGQGVLDLAFEANAAQLVASDSASVSHDSDVEMRTSDGEGDCDDGDSVLGESDGETTEEELVDERGLPTSRAMRLFRWPTSVSAINPMSTVSPNVSPSPYNRRTSVSTSQSALDSPRPADILAGKVFWEESDDHSQPDSAEGSVVAESPRAISRGGVPVMGQFSLDGDAPQKTAVLTGANKDIPSPFPRLGHRRRRFSSSGGSFSSMDLRGRTAKLSICTPFSLPPPSDEPSSEATPDVTLGESIQLDDVLDSTFLDSEPELHAQVGADTDGEQRHVQSLNRWDLVPVGAFRLTRESAASDIPTSPGWTSEPPKSAVSDVLSYGNVLKSSPLHTMLWHDKSAVKETPRKSKAGMDVSISPDLLPVRDGDHTPTHEPHNHDLHSNRQQQHTPHKTRKESRREMKMIKRKTYGPVHQQHHHHHQQHHRHNHHPNMKSRSTGSVQRTNFFSSPTNVPTLNI